MKKTAAERRQAGKEEFLACFSRKLVRPGEEWPTVRYWKVSELHKIFGQVREELAAKDIKIDWSYTAFLDWLCRLGLAVRLPVEQVPLYLVEMGASENGEIDPLELQMAVKPTGVICYFSAVGFHSLTTHIVEHHHTADLQPPQPAPSAEKVSRTLPESSEESPISPPRGLGKLLFTLQEIPFYSTRRSTRLIPGIQTRKHGPKAQLRITTLEQTLLDTLYKPFHCGGPDVVFEAWQEGIASRRIDEERLGAYLQAMAYPATTRRVAAMLELMGAVPGSELRRFFEDCQNHPEFQPPSTSISLLPGLDYSQLNSAWLVKTP